MHAQFIRGAYQGDCGPWRAERLRPTADDSAGDSESRHAERLGLTADCGTGDHGLRLDANYHRAVPARLDREVEARGA